MQASLEAESELTFHPAARTGFSIETATRKLEIIEKLDENENENDENDENDGNEGDFTFSCAVEDDASSSTAEEIFHNGKIRPVFPLFDQSLVELPHQLPPVKNVFVGAARQGTTGKKDNDDDEEEAAGPYCAWSSKAQSDPAASSPVECKKSNSTGFSKLWRFKEMTNRSNSDGRDTFVFLNKQAPDKQAPAAKKGSDKQAPDKQAPGSVIPAVASSSVKATAGKTKVGGKGKTTTVSSSASAHEVYVKSKAASREDDRRRTYLPYKPELVGFFTNVNGGMSKNVHPF